MQTAPSWQRYATIAEYLPLDPAAEQLFMIGVLRNSALDSGGSRPAPWSVAADLERISQQSFRGKLNISGREAPHMPSPMHDEYYSFHIHCFDSGDIRASIYGTSSKEPRIATMDGDRIVLPGPLVFMLQVELEAYRAESTGFLNAIWPYVMKLGPMSKAPEMVPEHYRRAVRSVSGLEGEPLILLSRNEKLDSYGCNALRTFGLEDKPLC